MSGHFTNDTTAGSTEVSHSVFRARALHWCICCPQDHQRGRVPSGHPMERAQRGGGLPRAPPEGKTRRISKGPLLLMRVWVDTNALVGAQVD